MQILQDLFPSSELFVEFSSLYSEHFLHTCITAVMCPVGMVGPVILSSVVFGETESRADYTYTPVWDVCLPRHRHSGTRNHGFTVHSKDEAVAQGYK
jgi:hypothetical protein